MNVAILVSEAYHDYYRWQAIDKKVFERWRAETHWGGLFNRYARGPQGPLDPMGPGLRGVGRPTARA